MAAGTYTEDLTVDKALDLQGDNAATTVIQPTAAENTPISIQADNIAVKDFKITHSTSLACGIKIEGSAATGLTLQDLDITNIGGATAADNGYGVFVANSFSGLDIQDCDFVSGYQNEESRGIGVFAPNDLTLADFSVTGSTFEYLFVGVYLRSAMDGLDINTSTFGPVELVDCTACVAGIYIGDGSDNNFDIENVEIANNTFTSYGRGVYIWNYSENSGVSNFNVENNTFANSIWSSGIRFIAGFDGDEQVSFDGITVSGNELTQNSDVGANIGLIDFRAYSKLAACDIEVSNNDIALSGGTYSDAIHGIMFYPWGDPFTNTKVEYNTLDGGSTAGSGTPLSTGIAILHDATTYWSTDVMSLEMAHNEITAFDNGVCIYDLANDVYGELPTGSTIDIANNAIHGNSAYGVRNDNGETIDATKNWWGASDGPSGEGPSTAGDAISLEVTYEPFYEDADMTILAYESDNPNVNEDTEVADGETLTVSGTLSIGSGSTLTVNGSLDATKVDMANGSIIDVIDGEVTLGTGDGDIHTIAGTFTIFNSFGSITINGDTEFNDDTLMLISDIHVADGKTITVSGSLALDGSTINCLNENGSFNIDVTDTGKLTMERTELHNANLTLSGNQALVRNNQFLNSDVTVSSGTTSNQVYHNVLDTDSSVTDNGGTDTVLSLDGWGNVSDIPSTKNDLGLNLNLTSELLENDRTLNEFGDVFVQPGDTVGINMGVVDLTKKISGVEAMLGFSTDYFDATTFSLDGEGNWSKILHEALVTDGVYGKFDAGIGLSTDYADSVGTEENGTVAKVTLTSLTEAEGKTKFYFRPRMEGDDSLAQTMLTGYDGFVDFELAPFTINTGYITVDDTAPEIANLTAEQQWNNGDLNLLNPNTLTLQGTAVFTVDVRDDNAGIDDDDVVLTIMHENGVTSLTPEQQQTEKVTIGEVTWTRYTYHVDIETSTKNGVYNVSAQTKDRSGNVSSELKGTIEVQKNECEVSIALEQSGVVSDFSRTVVFTATDDNGAVLDTWTKTVSFTDGSGSATLYVVPDGIANLSAKTAWNLRVKVPTPPTEGQSVGNFTGNSTLPGGDLNNDNMVNMLDYSILRYYWYTSSSEADINGDGDSSGPDYLILKANWYTEGDQL